MLSAVVLYLRGRRQERSRVARRSELGARLDWRDWRENLLSDDYDSIKPLILLHSYRNVDNGVQLQAWQVNGYSSNSHYKADGERRTYSTCMDCTTKSCVKLSIPKRQINPSDAITETSYHYNHFTKKKSFTMTDMDLLSGTTKVSFLSGLKIPNILQNEIEIRLLVSTHSDKIGRKLNENLTGNRKLFCTM